MDNKYHYLVELCAGCINKETGDEESLNAPFLFKSPKNEEIASQDGYELLYDDFNDWLQKYGKKGWFVDDELIFYKEITEAIDPIIVDTY